MSRVHPAAARGFVAILAGTILCLDIATADAKSIRLISVPGGSSSAPSAKSADSTPTTTETTPAVAQAASTDKPAADTDQKSRGELARMRADRALQENGEKAKVEDEEVISKTDKDPDDASPAVAKGEPVAPKASSKVTCIAGCN